MRDMFTGLLVCEVCEGSADTAVCDEKGPHTFCFSHYAAWKISRLDNKEIGLPDELFYVANSEAILINGVKYTKADAERIVGIITHWLNDAMHRTTEPPKGDA